MGLGEFLTTALTSSSGAGRRVLRVAWAAAGIAGLVALIVSWRIDVRYTIFGTAILLGLVAVVLSLSSLAKQVDQLSARSSRSARTILGAAIVMVWAFTLLIIASSLFLLTSFFFSWPIAISSTYSSIDCELAPKHVGMIQSLNNSELDSAANVAREVLAKYPDDLHSINTLGTVYFLTGNYAEAKSYFEKYVSLKPSTSNVRSNLADTYVELGRYEDAISTYSAMPIKDQDWQYEIARAHIYNHEYEKGLDLLRAVSPIANRGRSQVMTAVAYAGQAMTLSSGDKHRTELLEMAVTTLKGGVLQNVSFWHSHLIDGHPYQPEGFNVSIALLAPVLNDAFRAIQNGNFPCTSLSMQ